LCAAGPTLLLYLVPQTWKLGILRNIGALIGNLVDALAREGNLPYGTGENTLIGINERLLHMTRRCRANLQPPGYVFPGYFVFVLVSVAITLSPHINLAALISLPRASGPTAASKCPDVGAQELSLTQIVFFRSYSVTFLALFLFFH